MGEDLSSLEAERLRILWRQRLMAVPGGVGWLLHCARLYNDRERLLGPDHLGLPRAIAQTMATKEFTHG